MRLALRVDDELLHVALYSWLLLDTSGNGLTDKLIEVSLIPVLQYRNESLQIQSPYIEDFLCYTAKLQQDSTPILDLQWKYYEKNKNFIQAAKILDRLAQKERYEFESVVWV